MDAREIWKNIKLNQVGAELEIESLHANLMKEVQKCLKNYEAICHKTFKFEETNEEAIQELKEKLSQKLKEENYVYKINVTENKVDVILYLLDISEEQYKEIQEKRKMTYLGKYKESFVSGIIVLPFVFLYIILETIIISLSLRILGFSVWFWLIVALIVFLVYIFGTFYEKNRDKYKKEKTILVEQFKNYISSLERQFCTENSDKKDVKEIYEKYYEEISWNEKQ